MISLKVFLLIVLILVLFILGYLGNLSYKTRHTTVKGVSERTLTACPNKPNCVSSAATTDQHKINAFNLIGKDKQQSWEKFIQSVQQAGGEIMVNENNYCHAVFTSTLFRFKDDLEAALDENQINVRSASRAGTSDMGQNRKRVEHIRSLYQN